MGCNAFENKLSMCSPVHATSRHTCKPTQYARTLTQVSIEIVKSKSTKKEKTKYQPTDRPTDRPTNTPTHPPTYQPTNQQIDIPNGARNGSTNQPTNSLANAKRIMGQNKVPSKVAFCCQKTSEVICLLHATLPCTIAKPQHNYIVATISDHFREKKTSAN